MALTDEGGSGLVMPVAPMYGGGGGNGGFGNMGGDWGWIILLLLIAGNGWGGGFGGGFGGGGGALAADGAMLYPWMNQAEITSDGFRDQMINNNVTAIRDSIANLSTQLCNCCSDMQMSVANGFSGLEASNNARQIANMQQSFASQTAMMQGFNSIQSQFADCCCENRLANCQTQNVIQNEGNMTRFADANNTRDIIESQTRGNQLILDKLCQLELDQYKRENDSLRSQLTDARFNASQVAQTAQIRAGQIDSVSALVNELRSCPIPSQPVYGSQPIFTCPNNNSGCGCGCG